MTEPSSGKLVCHYPNGHLGHIVIQPGPVFLLAVLRPWPAGGYSGSVELAAFGSFEDAKNAADSIAGEKSLVSEWGWPTSQPS